MGYGWNSDGDKDRTFAEVMVRTALRDMVRPKRLIFNLRTWFDQAINTSVSMDRSCLKRLEQEKGLEGLKP